MTDQTDIEGPDAERAATDPPGSPPRDGPAVDGTSAAGVDAPPAASSASSETASSVDGAAPGEEPTAPPAPTFVVVEISSVSFSLPSPNPVIYLREQEPPYRGIEFPIGLVEAQSIALALEKETAPRPIAHELLAAVLVASGTDVIAVRVTGARDGTLLAELDLMTPRGREVLDCRPTDGIAVAIRQSVPAPILVEASLLVD